jgi:hypothetical protein
MRPSRSLEVARHARHAALDEIGARDQVLEVNWEGGRRGAGVGSGKVRGCTEDKATARRRAQPAN